MTGTLTHKPIADHLVEGSMTRGEEIGIRVDQTLTQDATGTMVMLELEAMDLDRVLTEVSAQYVDHNLIQEDSKNLDDHRFLLSACLRFGIWFSQAGNGVSHPRHMERLGVPGKTLLGSDSHTPAAGSQYFNRRIWKPALVASDIEPTRENGMHALRHYFASLLLEGGVSIRALADYLGHSDPGFTLRVYSHLMPTSDEKARAVVDGSLTAAAVESSLNNDPGTMRFVN